MKITVVYDNCVAKAGLRTGWGFSAFIETGDEAPLLFDTGADGTTLLYNMRRLGIEPRRIGVIVISHAHGDHTGGLSDVMKINKNAEIYIPASSRARLLERRVVPVSQPVQISKSIYSTGELQGIEQSLTIKTTNGIIVVAGCSHPGVATILDAASCYGKVCGIIGGLHGFHDFSRLDGLSLICPCHCTQYKSELACLFSEQYVACGVGLKLEL